MNNNQESSLKRIVFIATSYPVSYRPNSGIFLHRLAKSLSNEFIITVLHLRAWKPNRPILECCNWDGIKVYRLALPQLPFPGLRLLNMRIIRGLGYLLAKAYIEDADLLHSTGIFPTGCVVSRWARKLGKTHISQATGSDVNLLLANQKLNSTNWINSIDGIMCNSKALSKKLDSLVPNLSNVCVIYRGVDINVFTPHGEEFGPQVGFPPVRFLYLGGFQTWGSNKVSTLSIKGGHILMEAWKMAEKQLGNSSLLLGGPGANSSNINKWKSELCNPDRIIAHKAVNPEEVPAIIRAANVVVIPSLFEGLPNLANEAQACERPVLGTNAGGIPEAVSHGETGIIVPRNDAQALAEGLVWFYLNQGKIRELGINALHRMHNLFNQEDNILKVVEFFQNTFTDN
jgi:teichuronic acid biosynthesis glycosyltransferase TuaC